MTESINNGTDPGSDQPIQTVIDGVRSIVRALRVNTRAIEGQLGISLAQLWVLQLLNERSPQTLNELAEATVTHQSSVSVVVGRLVDAGMATRTVDPADRRQRRVQLTDAGRAILAKAPPTFQFNLLTGLQCLPPEQVDRLAALMQKWLMGAGVDWSSAPLMGDDSDGPPPKTGGVSVSTAHG